MFSGRVVYFNDAVTESILRIPAVDLEGGDYTVVVQGMGGATQKLLLYLRVRSYHCAQLRLHLLTQHVSLPAFIQ